MNLELNHRRCWREYYPIPDKTHIIARDQEHPKLFPNLSYEQERVYEFRPAKFGIIIIKVSEDELLRRHIIDAETITLNLVETDSINCF
jgi:hypothetical protein